MSVSRILETFITEANKELKKDESLQKVLKPYIKRRLLLNVKGDSKYSIDIIPEGLALKKERIVRRANDMYLEIDKNMFTNILRRQRLRMSEIRFIKHSNITIRELDLAGMLFKKYISGRIRVREPA